jgi:hypothetical protein
MTGLSLCAGYLPKKWELWEDITWIIVLRTKATALTSYYVGDD